MCWTLEGFTIDNYSYIINIIVQYGLFDFQWFEERGEKYADVRLDLLRKSELQISSTLIELMILLSLTSLCIIIIF